MCLVEDVFLANFKVLSWLTEICWICTVLCDNSDNLHILKHKYSISKSVVNVTFSLVTSLQAVHIVIHFHYLREREQLSLWQILCRPGTMFTKNAVGDDSSDSCEIILAKLSIIASWMCACKWRASRVRKTSKEINQAVPSSLAALRSHTMCRSWVSAWQIMLIEVYCNWYGILMKHV